MPTVPLDPEPLTNARQLLGYFLGAAKPRVAFRVGIEHEKLALRSEGTAVPYEGSAGIAELFRRLESGGWTPVKSEGHTIALHRGNEGITLEPGGQVEFAGPPLATASAGKDALVAHVREVATVARSLDIRFVSGGFRPFGTLDETPWFGKPRYEIMRVYLPRVGSLGLEMMKRTATVQVNLDFADEADALRKMRAACGVTSVVTALFAASPITEGKPNGHQSYRAAVWLDTDEQRCGIPAFVFEPERGLQGYVDWACAASMFFVSRGGAYHEVPGLRFGDFLRDGWRGERATMADWILHLSTLFPEVRLKSTIELRGADTAPLPLSQGLPALWRGLLDDPLACDATWSLVAGATPDDRQRLRHEVPRAGLRAHLGSRRVLDLARELCAIARAGLRRLPGGTGDEALLDPIESCARDGHSSADEMLAQLAAHRGDPAKLVDAWEIVRAL